MGSNNTTENTTVPSDMTMEEEQMYELFKQLFKNALDSKEADSLKDQDKADLLPKKISKKSKTKQELFSEDLEVLLGSEKSGRILQGTLVGMKSVNENKSIATYVGEIQFGNDTLSVLIPSYELYNYDLKKYRDPGEEAKVHNFISDMIGAEVNFIVRKVDEKTKTVYASRLAAMEKMARESFKKHDSVTHKPKINEGDIVDAKVINVRGHGIVVEINGVDAIIPGTKTDNRVSHEYVNDCRLLFRHNDIIPVKILSIEPVISERNGVEYKLYKIRASHKDTKEHPLITYWDSVSEGELGQAVVTGISKGSVFCKYKNRFTILCAYPVKGSEPYIGQARKVMITTKLIEEDGRRKIFGVFKDL